MMSIPRIGQEVVVTYLEGDPDQPLIAGVVYNSEQMPAYNPEAAKTKSGFKSNSSPGGAGFNEMRFEDAAGKEQFFCHAQKDMDIRVLNDQRTSILHDQHLTVHNDVFEKIVKNKDVQIGGDLQESIKGLVKRKIDSYEHETVKGGRFEKLGELNTEIEGHRNEKVGMSVSETIGMNLDQKVGMNMGVDAGMAVHIKAGMTLVLEAGIQLTLKAGASFIDISPAGIAISGVPLVMINSGGAAGSGAGANPLSPIAPTEPEPKDPVEAEAKDEKKAVSGQKSCP
jgi:type VI secretion system secreted protein VgrG